MTTLKFSQRPRLPMQRVATDYWFMVAHVRLEPDGRLRACAGLSRIVLPCGRQRTGSPSPFDVLVGPFGTQFIAWQIQIRLERCLDGAADAWPISRGHP